MKYWLMKTEPEVYGIDDLARQPKKTDHWDGIRNYQVRNMIRDEIKRGDLALLYHSNCKPPGVVGVVEIVKEAYPDHTAFDPQSKYYDPKSDPDSPRWLMVDVKLIDKFSRTISLPEMRNEPKLTDMRLLAKGNRLSIMPVTVQQWKHILSMAERDVA